MYGSMNCSDILQDDPRNRLSCCPQIVMAMVGKVNEIWQSTIMISGRDVE
jgi:hypothetical protein